MPSLPLYARIYDLVRQVPSGRVTTYGAIASLVGGCTARMVGYAMSALRSQPDTDVPWQRVINAGGKCSVFGDGYGNALQRQLLEEEGIPFDAQGRVDLDRFGWP
jgi:methylated-DNA-protein-cysteine methyltransferase-like protein